jgi:hypothetical protein
MNTTLRNYIKTVDNSLFAGSIRKLNRLRWIYQNYYLGYKYIKKLQAKFKCNNKVCLTSKKIHII